VFLALLHALLDLAGRAAPDGDPLTVLGPLLRAVTGGVRLVQLLRRPRCGDRRQPEVLPSGVTVPPMNGTPHHLPRRSIGSNLTARLWLELYAWLLAGLLLGLLVDCAGGGFDPGSPLDLGLGLLVLVAVRTGLVRWFVLLTGRGR
jgi:hypothetical protein